MISTDPALLDALADGLGSGDTLVEALDRVAAAKGAAEAWADHVRQSAREHVPVATALREAQVVDDAELSFFSGEGTGAVLASALHAVALRRRRRFARRRAIRAVLVVPFGLGALTIVLDPLPELFSSGAYVGPVLRGLLALVVVTLAIVAGAPALLRGPRVLRICTAIPGIRRLAALYAEEELTTALVPFAEGAELRTAGFAAAAALLAWSPLGDGLRAAAQSARPASGPLPMAGLDPLTRQLSLATSLTIVGGVASKRLAEQLALRAEAIALVLTARLRLVARVGAYALVVLFSVISLVDMISRGLPAMFTLPAGATMPDQKQLEDLLKQLGE